MTTHSTGTRNEWLAARLELLKAEKELTRRGDEVARKRQALPWVRIDKQYRFETEDGKVALKDLFRGRSQLLVYHFMFGPDYTAGGCATCSTIADGFNGFAIHLAHHDVMLWAVSRAPFVKLLGYKRRMGWTFPWASSFAGDFNADFNVSFTEEQQRTGAEHNFRHTEDPGQQAPGLSAFGLEDGVVYHTYSTYGRGVEQLMGTYAYLDLAPLGRQEEGPDSSASWWRRHDEYEHPRRAPA